MRERRPAIIVAVGLGLCSWLASGEMIPDARGGEDPPRATPTARVETESVPGAGDAADDPAIWVHPEDPARSLVLGTDKKGGLNVFDLDGHRLQVVSDGSRPNNVDVIYGLPLGGRATDVAVAGTRTRGRFGLGFWRIDPTARRLVELGPLPAFAVFDGGEPYGSCVYRSRRDGSISVFVTSKDGDVEQYRIEVGDDSARPIRSSKVRTLRVGSTAEGCVADHDLGWLYVAEEDVGVWRYGAEPDSGPARTRVARVGEHGLAADVEGLTIYYASGSDGYLIASSQGAGTFQVYRRDGSNAFVMTIDPAVGKIPDVGETDGIDVTNAPLSPNFSRGLFVCQDGKPGRDGRQNFKYFAWEDVAGDRLRIDTARPVRPR